MVLFSSALFCLANLYFEILALKTSQFSISLLLVRINLELDKAMMGSPKVQLHGTHEPVMKSNSSSSTLRSKSPRLRWTRELHELFVHVVDLLGGEQSEFHKCEMEVALCVLLLELKELRGEC